MEQERGFKFTDYQRAELENAFKKFSPNADGKIAFDSVESLMRSLEGTRYSGGRNDPRLISDDSSESSADTTSKCFPNEQHECDFDQFISIIEDAISKPEVFERALAQSVKLMDLKNTGNIDAQDLMRVASALGENISSEEEARRIISRAEDPAEPGKLTLKSLKAFLYNDIDPSVSP